MAMTTFRFFRVTHDLDRNAIARDVDER